MSNTYISKLESTHQELKSLELESSIRDKEIIVRRFYAQYGKLEHKNMPAHHKKYAKEIKSEFLERAARIGISRRTIIQNNNSANL